MAERIEILDERTGLCVSIDADGRIGFGSPRSTHPLAGCIAVADARLVIETLKQARREEAELEKGGEDA